MERMHHLFQAFQFRTCFLILITFSASCSDSMEMERDAFNESYFSPPSWILGNWEEIRDGEQEDFVNRSFEFTRSNFIVNPFSREIDQIDYNFYINDMRNYFPDLEVSIQVEKTEELYQLSISPPLLRDNYRFRKVAEDTLICRTQLGSYEVYEFRLKRID